MEQTTLEYHVCLGDLRYRVERPWSDTDMEAICDVFALPDGRVGVFRRKLPHILIFGPDGTLQTHWELAGMRCPHYASVGLDGRVYVVDLDGHQIFVLDDDGEVLGMLGRPAQPRWGKPFNHPTSAHASSGGAVYVADGCGNSCLHRSDDALNWTDSWGTPGQGRMQFSTPHAVRVLDDGRVLVVDRENNRVQILTPGGEYLGELGDLYKPMALAVLPDRSVLVTDHTPRLSRFRADGALLGRARTFSTVAHGVAVGHDGSIFLAEMAPSTLTRLVPVADEY